VAGIGGRNITKSMLKECLLKKHYAKTTFLGLKEDVIANEYKSINAKCGGCNV
jgi:hypothetical protein